MDSLLLDRTSWDLTLDAGGNIAKASDPYSIVQAVACACRLVKNELYYGGSQGVDYFNQVLGQYQPIAVLKAQLVAAALTVPGVLTAVVFLTDVTGRQISGQVQVTTTSGPLVITL